MENPTNHHHGEGRDIRDRIFAFIDLEMTGLDITVNEITEIGLVLARHTPSEDGILAIKKQSEHQWKVAPKNLEVADPVSLQMTGYSDEKWENAHSLETALTELAELTPEATMVGHNVAFDFAFLERAFRETGIENPMHYHKLDTISIAYGKLAQSEPDLVKFSLRELCEYFKIKNQNAHTALSDARATFELYEKLLSR